MKFKLIAGAAVVFATAIGGYWYYSPYLAIDSMQTAAKAGNGDAFNEHVDYPALRESLKGQLMASIASKAPSEGSSRSPSFMGTMIGTVLVNQMIDAFVRPETVMAMLAQGKTMPPAPAPAPAPAPQPSQDAPDPGAAKKEWSLMRISMNKVIASQGELADAEGGMSGLVFVRSGFATWKLSEIRIPANSSPD